MIRCFAIFQTNFFQCVLIKFVYLLLSVQTEIANLYKGNVQGWARMISHFEFSKQLKFITILNVCVQTEILCRRKLRTCNWEFGLGPINNCVKFHVRVWRLSFITFIIIMTKKQEFVYRFPLFRLLAERTVDYQHLHQYSRDSAANSVQKIPLIYVMSYHNIIYIFYKNKL